MWKSEGFIQEMSFTTVQLLLSCPAHFLFLKYHDMSVILSFAFSDIHNKLYTK